MKASSISPMLEVVWGAGLRPSGAVIVPVLAVLVVGAPVVGVGVGVRALVVLVVVMIAVEVEVEVYVGRLTVGPPPGGFTKVDLDVVDSDAVDSDAVDSDVVDLDVVDLEVVGTVLVVDVVGRLVVTTVGLGVVGLGVVGLDVVGLDVVGGAPVVDVCIGGLTVAPPPEVVTKCEVELVEAPLTVLTVVLVLMLVLGLGGVSVPGLEVVGGSEL